MVSIATLLAISPPPPLNRPRLLVEFLAALPLKPEGWTWETVTATEVGRDLVATLVRNGVRPPYTLEMPHGMGVAVLVPPSQAACDALNALPGVAFTAQPYVTTTG